LVEVPVDQLSNFEGIPKVAKEMYVSVFQPISVDYDNFAWV
jgi:hypothetical protein